MRYFGTVVFAVVFNLVIVGLGSHLYDRIQADVSPFYILALFVLGLVCAGTNVLIVAYVNTVESMLFPKKGNQMDTETKEYVFRLLDEQGNLKDQRKFRAVSSAAAHSYVLMQGWAEEEDDFVINEK